MEWRLVELSRLKAGDIIWCCSEWRELRAIEQHQRFDWLWLICQDDFRVDFPRDGLMRRQENAPLNIEEG